VLHALGLVGVVAINTEMESKQSEIGDVSRTSIASLSEMRSIIMELYGGCLGTNGEHFHPLSITGTKYGDLHKRFHDSCDTVVKVVEHCKKSVAKPTPQGQQEPAAPSAEGGLNHGDLRKYLHLSKDRYENEHAYNHLRKAFQKIQVECEQQAILVKAKRKSDMEFKFQNAIQNLKRIKQEISEIISLDFIEEIAPDGSSATITLGSHGEGFCFMLEILIVPQEEIVSSASLNMMIGDDIIPGDDNANQDLFNCVVNQDFDRLRSKILAMLETEKVFENFPKHPMDIKHLRGTLTTFFESLKVQNPSLNVIQHLEGPALQLSKSSTLVFLGPRTSPYPSGEDLALLFAVEPGIMLPISVASQLPSYFGHPNGQNTGKIPAQSSYSGYLAKMLEGKEDRMSVRVGEAQVSFQFNPEDKDTRMKTRAIDLTHILMRPSSFQNDFKILCQKLQRQVNFNALVQSCFQSPESDDSRMDIDLGNMGNLTQVSALISLSLCNSIYLTLTIPNQNRIVTMELAFLEDHSIPTVRLTSGGSSDTIQQVIQSTMSIPEAIKVILNN
jgi:hypothetical protein